MQNFESYVEDRAKGTEYEYLIRRAKQKDPEALAILRSKETQKRIFTIIHRRESSAEQFIQSILYKAGSAVLIIIFEKLINYLLGGHKHEKRK